MQIESTLPLAIALAIVAITPAEAAKKKACAGGAIERAICADADLAALARETERLSALALAGRQMTKEARAVFAAGAKDWRGERDACGAQGRDCLIEQHLSRINALRQITPTDAKGTSRGPTLYVCDGLAETVSAITVSGRTPRAYLAWGDYAFALSGKDGSYATELDSGLMTFATAPGGATLGLPGRGERACRPAG
ncbi:MAG: hypothetical protein JNK46_17465 [Methylobacteriaceae bacterium]|nr:hypothetical protein [Methylobacteriaceae bacterium]